MAIHPLVSKGETDQQHNSLGSIARPKDRNTIGILKPSDAIDVLNGPTMKRLWLILAGAILTTSPLAGQCSSVPTDPSKGLALTSRPNSGGSVISTLALSILPVSIRDCGAKGDGVTDDGAAIQAAITLATTRASDAPIGMAAVYVPEGTYAFTRTFDITRPLVIYGVPGGTSTLRYTGTATAIIWEHAVISGGTQVTQYPYGSGIRDLTLQGPGSNNQTVGLLCGNSNPTASSQGAAFWNFKIMQFRVGFKASNGCNLFSAINTIFVNDGINLYLPSGTASAGEGLGFEHCTFANPTTTTANVVIGNGWEVAFRRCSFDGGALLDSSTTTVVCESCHFENNANALNYDMLTVQNGFFTCTGCLFSNDDPSATDSQFIQVNGSNAVLVSIASQFANPANSNLPSRAVKVSLAKQVTLIGSVLNHKSLIAEWELGSQQATFGVQSFGASNIAVPYGGRASVGLFTTLTYSTTVNVDASRGNTFFLTVTNTSAFRMAAPLHPPNGSYQQVTFDIYNNSGGTMGAIHWTPGANGYRLAGAFTNPANGHHRTITFQFNASNGNWYEISRAAADIPN